MEFLYRFKVVLHDCSNVPTQLSVRKKVELKRLPLWSRFIQRWHSSRQQLSGHLGTTLEDHLENIGYSNWYRKAYHSKYVFVLFTFFHLIPYILKSGEECKMGCNIFILCQHLKGCTQCGTIAHSFNLHKIHSQRPCVLLYCRHCIRQQRGEII